MCNVQNVKKSKCVKCDVHMSNVKWYICNRGPPPRKHFFRPFSRNFVDSRLYGFSLLIPVRAHF